MSSTTSKDSETHPPTTGATQSGQAHPQDASEEVVHSSSVLYMPINNVGINEPLQWLSLGWNDFMRAPLTGLFFGVCFFLMGHALMLVFESAPAYVLALSAGFLLVGPFLSLGLYQVSKDLQSRIKPALRRALCAWLPSKSSMALFAGVLLILEMLWGRASLIVFAVSFDSMPDASSTWTALLNLDNLDFIIAYVLVGAVFAGLIFTTSVIAIPMILDKRVDAISAGLTSIRACLENPITMAFWGMLITVLVVAAMLPWFAGLLFIGPVLGHATWHAYQALVVPPLPEIAPGQ
jgi:uncharacterized membrane protein